MSESTLSISYGDLQIEVGRFLGYNADLSKWSDSQAEEVDRYIQAGIRQFYYPPAVENVEPGYDWSFLHPTGTLTTVDGEGSQDLSDDLGRIVGDLHFDPTVHVPSITLVSENMILVMQERNSSKGPPKHAAVRSKAGTTEYEGQRQEILLWPVPDKAYTLEFNYEAYSGKLTQLRPYPLGGMKHSELIVESCISVAEQRANDERGLHWESFSRLLASAVAIDRKNGARYFGQMGCGELPNVGRVRRGGGSYPISYKGVTW